ncbi:MAG: thioredoxin family protein [Methanothrix sp.]|nr:thioredoxin family protein [Methanothrix sp.]
MMDSVNRNAALVALAIICLLPLIMTGDCQAAPLEGQTGGNSSELASAFPEAPVVVNDDTLQEAISNYPNFVLDCWEIGCPPCKLIEPKIDRMAEEFKGRIVFAKLCIDRNPVTMSKFGISRTPTLLVFKNGTLVAMQVGNYPQEELKRMILTVLHMR